MSQVVTSVLSWRYDSMSRLRDNGTPHEQAAHRTGCPSRLERGCLCLRDLLRWLEPSRHTQPLITNQSDTVATVMIVIRHLAAMPVMPWSVMGVDVDSTWNDVKFAAMAGPVVMSLCMRVTVMPGLCPFN